MANEILKVVFEFIWHLDLIEYRCNKLVQATTTHTATLDRLCREMSKVWVAIGMLDKCLNSTSGGGVNPETNGPHGTTFRQRESDCEDFIPRLEDLAIRHETRIAVLLVWHNPLAIDVLDLCLATVDHQLQHCVSQLHNLLIGIRQRHQLAIHGLELLLLERIEAHGRRLSNRCSRTSKACTKMAMDVQKSIYMCADAMCN